MNMNWALVIAVAATVALMVPGEPNNADGSVPATKEMIKLILFPDVTSSPHALEAALVDLARLPAKGRATAHGTSRKRPRVALPAAVITTGSLATQDDPVDNLRSHMSQLVRFANHVSGVDVAAVMSAHDVDAVGAQVAEAELARLPRNDVARTDGSGDRYLELGVGYCAIVLSHVDTAARSAQIFWVEKRLVTASDSNRSCIVFAPRIEPHDILTEALVRHHRALLAIIQTTSAGAEVAIRSLPVERAAEGQHDGCLSVIELPVTLSTPQDECRAAPIVKLFLRKPTLLLTPVGQNRSQTVMLDTVTCSFHRNQTRPMRPPLCHSVLDRRGDREGGARQLSAMAANEGDSTASAAPMNASSESLVNDTAKNEGGNATADVNTMLAAATHESKESSAAESDEPTTRAAKVVRGSADDATTAADTVNSTGNNLGNLSTPLAHTKRKATEHEDGDSDEPRSSQMLHANKPPRLTTHNATTQAASDESTPADAEDVATPATKARKTRAARVNTTIASRDESEGSTPNASASAVPRRRKTTLPKPTDSDEEDEPTTTKAVKRKWTKPTTVASEQEGFDETLTPTTEVRSATGRRANETQHATELNTVLPEEVSTTLRSKGARRTAAPTPTTDEAGAADFETAGQTSSRAPRTTSDAGSAETEELTSQPATPRIKRLKPKSTAAAGRGDDSQSEAPTDDQQPTSAATKRRVVAGEHSSEAVETSEAPASPQQQDNGAASTAAAEEAPVSPPPQPTTADASTTTDAPTTTADASEEPTTKAPPVQPPAPAEDASTQFVNLFNILIATLIVVPSLAMVARAGAWLGVSSDQIKSFAGNHALSPALRAIVDVLGLVISCASVLFVFGSFVYNKWRQSRHHATADDGERAGMTSGSVPPAAGSDTESGESMKSAGVAPPVPKTVTIGKPKRKGAALTTEPKRPAVKGLARRSRSPDRATVAAPPVRGAVAIPIVSPHADAPSRGSAGAPSDNAGGSTRENSTKGASEDGWESDW